MQCFYGYLLITLHFANNKYVHPIDYKRILCISANPILNITNIFCVFQQTLFSVWLKCSLAGVLNAHLSLWKDPI